MTNDTELPWHKDIDIKATVRIGIEYQIRAGVLPQLHPNGFVQFRMPDGSRLHVWDTDLPPAQKVYTPIHDHMAQLHSTILVGRLEHATYDLYKAGIRGPEATHTVYEAISFPTHGQRETKLHKSRAGGSPQGDVIPRHTGQYSLTPGGTYLFKANQFHTSEAQEFTVTLARWSDTQQGNPKVLVPISQEPDNEFNRDQYGADLLRFVERAWEAL